MRLPATKAALNGLHARALARVEAGALAEPTPRVAPGRRPRVRDVATLLDESGLLWVSRCVACDDALRARRWTRLFVEQRARLARQVLPLVVGHGLLHKLARPYKAITAHCLLLDGAQVASADADAIDADIIDDDTVDDDTIDAIDRLAAAALVDASGDPHASRALPALHPLPVMGLPGWHPGNVDAAFFYDTQVFRPPR